MQVLDRRKALAIVPLLRLAFRPLFLAGCALAVLAIPLWLAALNGALGTWQPAGGWLAWHRHELVFGSAWRSSPAFCLRRCRPGPGNRG